MACPIKTYADIYDQTYGKPEDGNRGHFGHLIIRDSNTAFKDFLLVGVNADETSNLKFGIRLNAKQAKQIIRAINKWLARIGESEAAWKRELSKKRPGSDANRGQFCNAATMREALLRCDAIAQLPEVRNEQSIKDMRNIIKHALSSPPRNCDVGTVEEQRKRFEAYCDERMCEQCYLSAIGCRFAWAQRPYEKVEAAND